ncbi:PsbP domain-containing protein 7, chloroplastic [Zostera marina]|uniref:PsbP domain-containing protein 7, chloroplastic n=1 Tax=Zostera marina TaxID=29655 RepID=A0A0K9P5G5_ZOSMR|nr:PsbP domain-containing protein 7, chloroplastic [Zostera marina]
MSPTAMPVAAMQVTAMSSSTTVGDYSRSSFRLQCSENEPKAPIPGTEIDLTSPLAAVFRRRLVVGTGTAAGLALGANFLGLTSFLLGFEPEIGRKLKFDTIYPIGGYRRCLEINNGFEFIYPSSWVGDQALLSRLEIGGRSARSSDPVVAFGPPGSSGELNVSVIVSPVPPSFSMEAFGGAKEIGEAVVKNISGNSPQIKANLVESKLREDESVKYYELEFAVESLSFRRHDVAVCCVNGGKLLTLNAQSPESTWVEVKDAFYKIATSFRSFSIQT